MEITAIKQLLTLQTVLNHYNIDATNQRINCPFHPDKTPSMQLYPKTNTVYCFSSNCATHGKSLDVIDFIMYKENIDKHNAILKAQNLLGIITPITPTKPTYTQLEITAEPTITKAEFLEIMFSYFKNAIVYSKAARDYLKVRSLDATKLKVGYNTAQFHHGTRRDEALINNAVIYGLLAPWGANTRKPNEQAYKVFGKECIVFAMRNSTNKITGLYFRSTTDNENQKHFYLKDSTGLYPNYPNETTEKLIITESIIDAASLLQIESITKNYTILAAYGTNRLNEEMQAAIKALPNLNEIIFAFDNDEAGEKAVSKLANLLISQLAPHFQSGLANVSITTIKLPNKDVNETLQLHDENIFIELLEQRKSVFETVETTPQQPQQSEVKSPPSGDLVGLETQNEPAQLFVESKPKPIPVNQTENNTLNTTNPFKIIYTTQTAIYYVKGGIDKVLTKLAITLEIENNQLQNAINKRRFKIDLFDSKQIEKAAQEANEYLELSKNEVTKDLHFLTEALDEYRENEQLKNTETESQEPQQIILSIKERAELETFLKQPKVIKRLNEMLGKTGIVGEERNRIFLMLIAISYKMKDPLHALIQGSSGSGKTKIVRQVSDCIPQESVTRFTRISDKALYNYPKNFFTNRLLIIEDVDGLSEDAEMAFRELQSSGELRSSVSIKLENGSITGGEKIVSGPIASMSCTTKGEIYEDNMSRVFLIAVDESGEQTKRIIQYQNQKASGKINNTAEQNAKIFIQNLIRIIEPKEVINPFAEQIQLPEEAHKIRRLNDLFQNFIKMVALINQYQRKQNEYKKVIANIEDVETAIEIMFESIVLKVDELDGSLRQFYEQLKTYLQKNNKENYNKIEFTQRTIRQALNLSKAQINRYLQTLVDMEYISYSGFANKGFTYKIMYWDNYQNLRKRIKDNLSKQIEALKCEPLVSR